MAASCALVALVIAAYAAGSQSALLGAEMAPTGALALLFINCYGMLSLFPKYGQGPRAAFVAAVFIGEAASAWRGDAK